MTKIIQDEFWKSNFGNKYTIRNNKKKEITSLKKHFGKIFKDYLKNDIKNVFEFGTNRGLNLDCFNKINPKLETHGLEINNYASKIANKKHKVLNISALNFIPKSKYDLVVTRVFLIHIHPKNLNKVYNKIYNSSKKYIYIEEYFSHESVGINYRNNKNVLFKRDFAYDFIKNFNLKVIDYGFNWKHDKKKPLLDNTNWFLFKKK